MSSWLIALQIPFDTIEELVSFSSRSGRIAFEGYLSRRDAAFEVVSTSW